MMRRKRWIVWLLFSVIFLIGCEEPVDHSELVIARANDAIGLDPATATETEAFKVTVNLFETLVSMDETSGEIQPLLAESWQSSEDGLRWTFRIREDVRFHDGTLCDAEAVAFNFERWMNDQSPFHAGNFSYYFYNFGGFPGIIESVTALSDRSLEIILERPYAPFLSTLSMPAFAIASPDAIVTYNDDLFLHPVGTGPFQFVSWSQGEELVLERYDDYWNKPSGVGRLVFRTVPESAERLALLEEGAVHIAYNLKPQDAENVVEDPNLVLHRQQFLNLGYLAINNTKPPFDDVRAREAIAYLIDKEKMIDEVFGNVAREAHSFLPPVLWGYHEKITSRAYDLERAQNLWRAADGNQQEPISLWVMTTPRTYFPDPMGLAAYLEEQFEGAGIAIEVVSLPWDDYLERIKEGEHHMALVGWNADQLDPDNFLYTFFTSEHRKPGIAFNYSFYSNPQVDDLLKRARETTDRSFRISLYREMQEIIYAETPAVPLVHTMPAIGVSRTVQGYRPLASGNDLLKEVTVK